jgi:PIN domain nuclease of toxin-antitoxin system
MRYLLDTHVLLWWLDGTDLSEAALEVLSDSRSEVFVSPVSAIEMSIKSSRGRVSVPDDLPHLISDSGFETLTIRWEHAWRAGQLPWHHRDPFDRLLLAQALVDDLTIMTRDPALVAYDPLLMIA